MINAKPQHWMEVSG